MYMRSRVKYIITNSITTQEIWLSENLLGFCMSHLVKRLIYPHQKMVHKIPLLFDTRVLIMKINE